MDDRTNEPPKGYKVADDDKTDVNFESDVSEGQVAEESNFEQTLSKPIQAHGEEVRRLTWREPTGADIERAGNPIIVDFFGEKPSLTFNEKKMSAMISALCQIPPSSVRQLTAGDWNAIAWKLVRFFMPRVAG
jgi:hypothetical protein